MTLQERYDDTVGRRGSPLWQRSVGAIWEVASYWIGNFDAGTTQPKRDWMKSQLVIDTAIVTVDTIWGVCLSDPAFVTNADDATVKGIVEATLGGIYGYLWA
jgi:hypothetical protein